VITKLAKILAVFVAVTSLAFAGFAIATTFSGPDWRAMTQAKYFEHYSFTQGGAPDFAWTATRVADGDQIATSRRLPEVLVKVMDDILARQQEQLQVLSDQEPLLQARVESLEQDKAADEQALEKYVGVQRERLNAVRKQIETTGEEVIAATNEAQGIEKVIALRREEVAALKRQVQELKTDRFRLEEVQRNLENLLIQTQGDNLRAKSREQGLEQQVP